MPHKPHCPCPICGNRRGETDGESPRLTIRMRTDLLAHVRTVPGGARRYIEALITADLERTVAAVLSEGL